MVVWNSHTRFSSVVTNVCDRARFIRIKKKLRLAILKGLCITAKSIFQNNIRFFNLFANLFLSH